jgi:transposase
VPKQHSTGGQTHLLGISKRGDRYLRKLLIHGARATLRWVGLQTNRRSQWIRGLLKRRGWNRTAVAVANKNARIVWALLSRGGVYSETASRRHRVIDKGETSRKPELLSRVLPSKKLDTNKVGG